MALNVGQNLAHYQILAPLGAGGMGEVWRARDTRLAREVAIKVLPADVASDPDRLRRFEREARALASLSHPHVAQVFGIDEVDGTAFMAMELVPGEDLAARLSRGPLPLEEALHVCRQIAEGLEAAHEAGVVHRDLKPANVQLTPDGRVKLLDFGLAKAVGPQPDGDEVSRAEPDSALLTEEGRVLGTPVYMSPEQARGRSIDRRTDLWSLGCVLYECLTGRRPFAGRSPSDVIASILKDDPDWSALPPLPPRVDELLRRCLQKDARMRLRDAGEARVQLVLAAEEPSVAHPTAGSAPARGRSPLAAALLGVAGLAVGTVLGLALASDDDGAAASPGEAAAPAPRRLRFAATSFDEPTALTSMVMSPAADSVAWIDQRGLRVRRFDELEPRMLVEDDEMSQVARMCWSPDGRELAWIRDDTLWRMPLDSAEPFRIATLEPDATGTLGMHWAEDGRLITVHGTTIMARSAVSNASEVIFSEGEGEGGAGLHHFDATTVLPGGRVILVVPHEMDRDRETVERIVDGEREVLARYEGWDLLGMAWADDRLFLRTNVDSVARWWWVDCPPDVEGPLGEPRPTPFTSEQAAFGKDGTVAWVVQEGRVESQLVRLGTDGAMTPLGRRHDGMLMPSPQVVGGRRLLFGLMKESGRESSIWSYDRIRGVDSFVMRQETPGPMVVALEDDRFLVSSFMPQVATLHDANGNGEPRLLDVDGMVVHARPDGRQVLFTKTLDVSRGSIGWDDLDDDAPPVLLREQVRIGIMAARFSPDGRWMVFVANDSGERQAYLSRVPPDGREWQVSVDETDMAWFDDAGDSIILSEGGVIENTPLTLRRVSFSPGPEPELGLPEVLHTFEDNNLLLVGGFPGSDDLYGTLVHPPIAHDIVIESGWVPEG